ncbi:MlaD family protein [Mycolicibacterium septicum]|uniref:MlaD family protein n=1 Tax=Mycolicibacterium septicum TaxID=98668 RepID=UPI0023608B66|nr:MlaD family protein [Mycolicibacterium septicum]
MAALNPRRVGRVAATAVTAMGLAAAVGSCASTTGESRADYCAIMPDSVGLYPGNSVTQMGYQIGTVTSITPDTTDVRVDFTVTAQRQLPKDVKAIIRSSSVLADRSLELVGNPEGGPQLGPAECIPLSRSFTPKSLSQTIGSATNFVNSLNPDGSTNIADVVRGIDQAIHNNGAGVNQLFTTTSSVLDSPDQVINSLGSVVTNLTQLTSLIKDMRAPLKQILLDMQKTTPDVAKAVDGGNQIFVGILPIDMLASDIEVNLGQETQATLDTFSMAIRKGAAHAPAIADLLTPVPWWINTVANHYNSRPWNLLQYRPPMYRIGTPDGVALCNIMNASAPGTCANIQGQPYAVDVALLQYVLTQANR